MVTTRDLLSTFQKYLDPRGNPYTGVWRCRGFLPHHNNNASDNSKPITSLKSKMGRLVGLELENFKSYKGTIRVGFGDASFTSIIGPNGAGKSNMMDAISFVLGVQSSHLRSQNLKDLVYRGLIDSSKNSSLDPLNDPNSAYVCAVYEKDNGELMNLKRTITPAGGSDYKINDKSVTALQYTMALKAENILVKARNFLVFQGDIENIASQSPKDIAKLIETISGSAEYAPEYESLREENERAHEVATEVFSRKRNLNSESKQYKEQMKEREIFELKLTEKNNLIKTLHLFRIFHNEKRHFQILGVIRRVKTSIEETSGKLVEQQESYDELMAEYAADNIKLRKQELQVAELQSTLETSKRGLIPITANTKSLESKIQLTKKKIADLKLDLENQIQQKRKYERNLADAERLSGEFEQRIRDMHKKVLLTPEDIKEYEALRGKFLSNSGSQLEEELTALINEQSTFESAIRNYDLQKENALSKVSELESEIQLSLGPKFADLKAELKNLLDTKTLKVKAKEALLAQKEKANLMELELNSNLRTTLLKLEELSSEQKESKKQKKLRDNVSMLRNMVKEGSIKGLMYELVSCSQKKYETSLHTVLGPNVDAIVVESTAVAYKCIELLKERRAGTATFIPLDSIVNEQVNLNYLRSLHENARPAVDIVKFDDVSIERAVQFVLGDTIIVDTIEDARELKWNSDTPINNKMVSLDGSIVHKSGLMTGGPQDQNPGLRWSKEQWNQLNAKKDELNEKILKVSSEKPSAIEINNLTDEISQIDDELPLLRSKISSYERRISERNLEIKFHTDIIAGLDENINEKRKEAELLNHRVEEAQAKISALQTKIYKSFCEKHNLESISDYESIHGSALRIRARERVELQKAITTVKNQLSFQSERINETENRIEKLQTNLGKFEANYLKLKEDLAVATAQMDTTEAELELLAEEVKIQKNGLSQKLKDAKTKEYSIKDLQSELKAFNKELMNCEELVLKVDSERLNMLKNCKIENVDLPLEDGFLESVSLGDGIEDVSSVAYKIRVDYSMLDFKYQDHFSVKIEAEIRVQIENIDKDIQLLTPNAKALERLKEVDQKLKEFDREFTKARQTEKKTTERFNEVKSKRTELFMNAFNHISQGIDGIYKELTKSNESPLGGSAYLTLEDEEEPYLAGIKYHAMPPMKRFRDMDLLSGGEKTMAALALLFTIHSYQPAPFFVLDEIDAALDNSNVTKISNYIKRHAGPGFQFIVISLKSTLFENSDSLVGIYREQRENSSKTVTLDLRNYANDQEEILPAPVAEPSTTQA